MLDQNRLDLFGGNVFPTRHDDILQPIFDEQVTMLVDPADIAGSKPAVRQDFGSLIGHFPVTQHDLSTANSDLSRHSGRNEDAVPIRDTQFRSKDRKSGRSQLT